MSTRADARAGTTADRWLAATRALIARGLVSTPAEERGRSQVAQRRLRALAGALRPDEPGARGHTERVGALCRRLSLAIGLTADEAEIVALAGQLHDAGAAAVVHAVDRGEPACRHHPVIGAQLVAPFDVLDLAAPMIRHHRERRDGSGRPDGLRGDAIPLGARIIAVADEYDHLTRAASGAPLSHGAALGVLAGRTHALDDAVIAALIELPLP